MVHHIILTRKWAEFLYFLGVRFCKYILGSSNRNSGNPVNWNYHVLYWKTAPYRLKEICKRSIIPRDNYLVFGIVSPKLWSNPHGKQPLRKTTPTWSNPTGNNPYVKQSAREIAATGKQPVGEKTPYVKQYLREHYLREKISTCSLSYYAYAQQRRTKSEFLSILMYVDQEIWNSNALTSPFCTG